MEVGKSNIATTKEKNENSKKRRKKWELEKTKKKICIFLTKEKIFLALLGCTQEAKTWVTVKRKRQKN